MYTEWILLHLKKFPIECGGLHEYAESVSVHWTFTSGSSATGKVLLRQILICFDSFAWDENQMHEWLLINVIAIFVLHSLPLANFHFADSPTNRRHLNSNICDIRRSRMGYSCCVLCSDWPSKLCVHTIEERRMVLWSVFVILFPSSQFTNFTKFGLGQSHRRSMFVGIRSKHAHFIRCGALKDKRQHQTPVRKNIFNHFLLTTLTADWYLRFIFLAVSRWLNFNHTYRDGLRFEYLFSAMLSANDKKKIRNWCEFRTLNQMNNSGNMHSAFLLLSHSENFKIDDFIANWSCSHSSYHQSSINREFLDIFIFIGLDWLNSISASFKFTSNYLLFIPYQSYMLHFLSARTVWFPESLTLLIHNENKESTHLNDKTAFSMMLCGRSRRSFSVWNANVQSEWIVRVRHRSGQVGEGKERETKSKQAKYNGETRSTIVKRRERHSIYVKSYVRIMHAHATLSFGKMCRLMWNCWSRNTKRIHCGLMRMIFGELDREKWARMRTIDAMRICFARLTRKIPAIFGKAPSMDQH